MPGSLKTKIEEIKKIKMKTNHKILGFKIIFKLNSALKSIASMS